jgi:1-pyrroline-5-carboxylate dehydrogenase
LVERMVDITNKMTIGDPTQRNIYLGPVINKASYRDYQNFCQELSIAGKVISGGKVLTEGDYARGFYCTPTIVVDLIEDHHLWQTEMFLPIVTIAKITNFGEALRRANDVDYGLTAGVYGSIEEIDVFYDQIEAGVTYANRPLGATTGAWPGFQPFGGWKGSGSTGKNAGGVHYLQLYMHEQIRNRAQRA